MAETRKTYGEGCIGAHALDLIGDRWALLIVRELMLGPKRFGAIKVRVPNAATNMLTRRLSELESSGVVFHRTLPPPASVPVYELTPQGYALWPLLRELCRWGVAMPGHDPSLPISPTALMLSMRAMMLPQKGRFTAGFDIEGEGFLMTLDAQRVEVIRDPDPSAEMRFSGTGNALAAVVYGLAPLNDWIAQGAVRFDGDPVRGQSFIDRFRLARPEDRDNLV